MPVKFHVCESADEGDISSAVSAIAQPTNPFAMLSLLRETVEIDRYRPCSMADSRTCAESLPGRLTGRAPTSEPISHVDLCRPGRTFVEGLRDPQERSRQASVGAVHVVRVGVHVDRIGEVRFVGQI